MSLTHAFHDMTEEMHDLVNITHVDAARQAYLGLWATFVVVPLVFGLDKFAGFLGVNWDAYLATWVNNVIPGTAAEAVTILGGVELLLAVGIALMPRIGGDLTAVYLVGAAISVFVIGGGTMVLLGITFVAAAVCALAMARMSRTYTG